MNLFRGKVDVSQVLPYPINLDEERKEMLQMVIAPTFKFLEEINKPME
jgi:hypothetical protein